MNALYDQTFRSTTEAPTPRRRPVAEAAPTEATERKRVYWTIPGFGPMTRISTSFGEVPAQALRERDTLRTQTGGFARIVKVQRYTLDDSILTKNKDTMPILIRAGALGMGLPKADIVVSPEQELAIGSSVAAARLVKARDLLNRPGVSRKPETIFTYTQIRCDTPAMVRIEGIWARVS